MTVRGREPSTPPSEFSTRHIVRTESKQQGRDLPAGARANKSIVRLAPHYQQSCPPCLTYPSGGPTMNDEIAL
jgi:hypothetical protein